ncbi:NAD(P)/FAD-dependent oxidoreductase [Thermomonas haemolytica]|uniref:Sulfide:quinone oxidoreductase n=1 Tax=Thermomonas haemolytica TaxID=141949 RepID=A0A4R3N541_9GAMM|nr:FAD-dependent oxidoreductase [Thermomonas haemolytica]TCT21879.1 sulfide:quinone oxidoreductase [Thermomonas haemolytica]TNY29815.1 pyridine nucleotide-disulfide oxidoreductase [Thermomonas haemolytica]
MASPSSIGPHVLVLGGNFAGLSSAQRVRQFAGPSVRITVIDRKDYLLFVPNIPADVFEDQDPALRQRMELREVLAKDDIAFVQGEVKAIDVDRKRVEFVPNERPGSETQAIGYDYLVIAVGNRLAYDAIEGFAEFGHTVSDLYHGNRLREYLHRGGYRGGPVAIGSARFHQGNGAKGLQPYPGGSIPDALAACEGPPVEVMLSMATWLGKHGLGGPDKVTVFTPAELIAEDAGETVVKQLLEIASGMGFHYMNKTQDIRRLTADGIEFADGRSVEAELKIIFPDWVAHDFLKGLPICDDMGFVKTDLLMRNPDYPSVFAAGDAAAVTVPKLGAIGHQQTEIVGRQIAKDLGALTAEEADRPLQPVVYCIGDMGGGKAFYIRSNTWYGGDTAVLKMGRMAYFLKMRYRDLFFQTHGKTPDWGLDLAELLAEGHTG